VHYNPVNFTFWTNAAETFGSKVNGTYIYSIDLHQISTGAKTLSTLVLNLTEGSLAKTKYIKINLPFYTWYTLNREDLPYSIWTPIPKKKESSLTALGL